MTFKQFKDPVEKQFNKLVNKQLFIVDVTKEQMWDTYLKSFPPGYNVVYKERLAYDCNCCRNFIQNIGRVVAIVDGELKSVWDCVIDNPNYQPVADALNKLVTSAKIESVWRATEPNYGTDSNKQLLADGTIKTWSHFFGVVPHANLIPFTRSIGEMVGPINTLRDVFKRGLETISDDSLSIVLELIGQNSLHRGEEKLKKIKEFAKLKAEWVKATNKDLWLWSIVAQPTKYICLDIRNDVVGTLLTDLSEGRDLEAAVKSFEDKVSGTNYKRSSALVTQSMRDKASALIKEKGLTESLYRRYAELSDIPVNQMLFVDRSVSSKLSGDPFDMVPVKEKVQSFDKVATMPIEDFIVNILPTATSLEVYLENKHERNLVSLIAPVEPESPGLFKWNNKLSWSYIGDVADSVKERVKLAGGNVNGVLRVSLSWFNMDDLDLHIKEPDGTRISFSNRKSRTTLGELDIDMNCWGELKSDAVENIIYPSIDRLMPGKYQVIVNNFAKRENVNVGFQVDVQFMEGNVETFSYDKAVPNSGNVEACVIKIDSNKGCTIDSTLKRGGTTVSKEVWGLTTASFHKVNLVMLSPNFWDGQEIGNKHYMFMLDKCSNQDVARGFYNEYLSNDLHDIRKAMEMLGSKLKTEVCEHQLSGIGFSSTQSNELVVRVKGSFNRVVKVLF